MNRQEIFEWVKATYGTEPDYPWNDWNAVLRHKIITNGTVWLWKLQKVSWD